MAMKPGRLRFGSRSKSEKQGDHSFLGTRKKNTALRRFGMKCERPSAVVIVSRVAERDIDKIGAFLQANVQLPFAEVVLMIKF